MLCPIKLASTNLDASLHLDESIDGRTNPSMREQIPKHQIHYNNPTNNHQRMLGLLGDIGKLRVVRTCAFLDGFTARLFALISI